MKNIYSKDGRRLCAEMYATKRTLGEIASDLTKMGYVQNNGSPIHTSVVSKIAHDAGLPRRTIRTKMTVRAPYSNNITNIDAILAVAALDLDKKTKHSLIKTLLK